MWHEKVGIVAVTVLLSLLIAYFGFQLANRGFDALDNGMKLKGIVLFWSGVLLSSYGNMLVIYVGIGWLVHEGGWR